MTSATPRETLRTLLWPVYAPSFGYAAGISALLPAQVVLALHLGFTAAQVALLATAVGGFAIVASFAAGYLVQWLGEGRALAVTTAPTITLLLATWLATAHTASATARVVLIVALLAVDLSDAVWSIARQGLVADLAPLAHRGRAMNVYGASQRLGRVLGPFVAAAVLAVADAGAVFPVAAAFVAIAWGVLAAHLRRLPAPSAEPGRSTSAAAPLAAPMSALFILGAGVLMLSAVRTAKETLIPLWGADGLHLAPATVALVVGIGSLAELVLFWPAGLALDRLGRAPVATTCLALMGVGLMVMPFSHTLGWFVAAAILVGLGDGVGAGIVKTMGIDIAPARDRGRFLGWWQSISSIGSFVAPALAGAVIGAASLAAALPAVGVLGIAGAAWMAWWTPRFIPRPARAAAPHTPADR